MFFLSFQTFPDPSDFNDILYILLNMYDESDLNVSNFYQNPTAKNRSFIANGDASLGRERRLAINASGKEFLAWASATILSLQLSPDPAQVD